ncbi:MAG TPA: enoyl-CoA hydratase/isomerase family protein [Longimicrobiales bacterium]|nr:enoyl-CoA hydratase/isomerase family protein [Longimicrobiales bacterium]
MSGAGLERLVYDVADGVAAVTLNRPEKRNALDARTVEELRRVLGDAAADPAVRVVLLRGAGPDFCSGADLSELEKIARGGGPIENLADAAALGELLVAMRRHPKPIVAAVHGHAFAGGAGLATACDIVLAADDAVFGYPEVRLGFVPAMVMAILRRTSSEKVAFELAARGERISAAEAQRVGLVNRLYAAATLQADALEYARDLAGRSASALLLIKRLLYGMDGMGFEDAIARGAEVNALARATEDCQAGVRRFLDSRRR